MLGRVLNTSLHCTEQPRNQETKKWYKVFKNEPIKMYGKQASKNEVVYYILNIVIENIYKSKIFLSNETD